MGRKFINRKKKEVSAEDEWEHITGIESGPDLKIQDAMDIQERKITLSKEKSSRPKTAYEIIKEETRNAMDAAGNTGQYIRFVKLHIDKQKSEIDKIKKIKEKFDDEIKLLQSQDLEMDNLDSKSLDKFDVKTITKYLQKLLEEKGSTKKKLDKLKSDIDSVENIIKTQENQIEELNKELHFKKRKEVKRGEDISIIKEDLNSLIEKYGASNVSKVLDKVKAPE